MSRSINDINSTLISLCAILDSWCDLEYGLHSYHEGQRHTLHNFLLESYITLHYIQKDVAVPPDRKIVYASMLHDMNMDGLRKELRQLLFEYLCVLEGLERRVDEQSLVAIGKIDSLLLSNHPKIKAFEINT